ncbi:hypothetical protein SCHPADRAFT_942834 [Schizopora paradoxa]|uniref:Uncharacterized protein n=1 Tax=Schizopora paradoxa TaxID=27342 RepID=A0A0H2RFY5_9AGAM|nr:hypothetical protein SCHPADRAFT_942834 [Schizopora paradoxa]
MDVTSRTTIETGLAIEAARQLEIIRYTIIATVTFVIYEYLIRIDDEVRGLVNQLS